MALQGVADRSAVPDAELDAYVDLLKREYGGHAFLQSHARLRAHSRQAGPLPLRLEQHPLPRAGRLGRAGPRAKLDLHGEAVRRAAGAATIHRLPAKHFLQEDQAPAIAELVTAITRV